MTKFQRFLGRFVQKKEYVVLVEYDEEDKVYIATSDDIPGLVLEVDSLDDLAKEIVCVLPDLLDNNHIAEDKKVVWNVIPSQPSLPASHNQGLVA